MLLSSLRSSATAAAIASLLAAACSGVPQASPSPSAPATNPPPAFPPLELPADATASQRIIARVGQLGGPDLQAALDAFAIAFEPLPGTQLPAGEVEPHGDGTLAVRWIRHFWAELTPEQQAFADALIRGEVPAALRQRWAVAAIEPLPPRAPPALGVIDWPSLAASVEPQLAALFKRQMKADIEVISVQSPIDIPAEVWDSGAWAEPTDANGEWTGQAVKCTIRIAPDSQALSPADAHSLMVHEIFHCFEMDLDPIAAQVNTPAWVQEGAAKWAEMLIGEGNYDYHFQWAEWLEDSHWPLWARKYDAHGIYWLLHNVGVDPWSVMDKHLLAARGGTLNAYFELHAAGGDHFVDTWGSRYFMLSPPDPDDWRYFGSWQPTPLHGPAPPFLELLPDTEYEIAAMPYAATLGVAKFQSDVIVITPTAPHGLAAFPGGQEPLDEFTDQPFCTNPEGCACEGSQPGAGANFRFMPFDTLVTVGATGHLAGILVTFRGLNLGDYCEEQPPPSLVLPDDAFHGCETDCGHSHGDPHLTTIDGHHYDFQAAGEFVLLRGADGRFEIQARQVPYQDSDTVTINRAIALRYEDTRLVAHVDGSTISLVANGAPLTDALPASVGSLTVVPVAEGVAVAMPDGTAVWLLAMADDRGLNVVLNPSDALREGARGLLGPIAGAPSLPPLPTLPDGSFLDASADYRDTLYGAFAGAWAVTAATSLFDYAAGEGPHTFRDPSIPAPGAPLDFSELTPQQQQAGLAACAAIADQALRAQCAFDVIVTGDAGYVDGYAATNQFLVELGGGACTLLNDDEITAATGYPVLGHAAEPSEGVAACLWELDASPDYSQPFDLRLNLYSDGRRELDLYLGSCSGAEAIPDLGDEAYEGCFDDVLVLVGTRLVALSMEAIIVDQAALAELARHAVGRL